LDKLKLKYKLHIITNGFEHVQHFKIKNSGLGSYFDFVFTAEQVGFKKPHPQIFIEALNKTQALPEKSLMIGDSLEADILGALAQGMHAIHFNSHQEERHDYCLIVNSLEELSTFF
jgi:putative hydrolase of the HAD superfamily